MTDQKKPKPKKQPRLDVNQTAFGIVQTVIDKSEGKSENPPEKKAGRDNCDN
jgi:hypothetical protein